MLITFAVGCFVCGLIDVLGCYAIKCIIMQLVSVFLLSSVCLGEGGRWGGGECVSVCVCVCVCMCVCVGGHACR